MKKLVFALLVLAFTTASAQTDWKKTHDKLMEDGSYKDAYAAAENVFRRTKSSPELLAAARAMAESAAAYQEDAADSSLARYRSILPRLEAPERAVCYAWLGVADSALMEEAMLKQTPFDCIKPFLENEEHGKNDVNLTPTVFDVVAQHILADVVRDSIALMQNLIDFHSGDSDDLRILLDLQLMQKLWSYRPNEANTEERLRGYINKYRGSKSPQVTKFYHEMARVYSIHERYVEAVAYCDSAIALFPRSSGAVDCANLRTEILSQKIGIQASSLTIAGRPSLHVLEVRNLSRVHLALYPYKQKGRDFEFPAKLGKPLQEWQLDVDDNGDHKEHKAIFHLPALERGTYLLVSSVDGTFGVTDAYSVINSTDFLLLRNGADFQLVDAVSGDPIEGQEVVLLEWYSRNPADTAVSYPDGRFRLEVMKGRSMGVLSITRGGHSFLFNSYSGWAYGPQPSPEMTENARLMTDRPIYRPGDTAHIAALLYEADGVNGRTVGGRELTLRFDTPNGKRYCEWKLRTDAHGVADTLFVIPTDVLTGTWTVTLHDEGRKPPYLGYVNLCVEEYKQPKFMVSLDDPTQNTAAAPALGEPYTLRGRATAYSGASLGSAKVRYTVVRESFYWFRGYEQAQDYSFTDSTTTAADGSFDITFTPQPDSSIDLSRKPYFRFRVMVDVTDLNGETHSASASFTIGYCNERVSILGPKEDITSLNQVQLSYTDLNSRPLSGKVHLNLYHLRLPDTLRLAHPVVAYNSDAQMTLSRSEFRRLFPQYAYSAWEYAADSLEADMQLSVTLRPDGTDNIITVPIEGKRLPSGLYRIVARTDNVADTVYVCLTLPKEKNIANTELLWGHLDTASTAPGDRVTLSYASAFEGTRFFYTLTGPEGNELDSRWLPAGRRIKRLSIPIDSSMLGGVYVRLTTVRDGIDMEWTKEIDVPFTHKRLDVDIATFRDKLQPGEQEQWTLRTTSDLRPQTSHLILTMYDDALNSYGSLPSWNFSPWRSAHWVPYERMDLDRYRCSYYPLHEYQQYDGPNPYRLSLRSGFTEAYRFYGRRMYKNARSVAVITSLSSVETEDAVEEEVFSTARGESNMVTMQGNVRKRTENYDEVAIQTSADEAEADAGDAPQSPTSDLIPPTSIQLRTDFSTLAFFVARLHTDSTGAATYRFRVPELLTRWNVRGLAFTDDLKLGTLDRTLVTQKPLMVQPNIPRFLRQGDSLMLMAKVVNLTDTARRVRVAFSYRNAADNSLLDSTVQFVNVDAQGSAQVMFRISQLPSNLHVATYTITASAPGMSDGERGQIPVLTNRQAVTVSQSLYINGPGTKTFHFPLPFSSPKLGEVDAQRADGGVCEPKLLTAEVVGEPYWLAIKTMPYLKTQENPSTLYLANQYFVNSRGPGVLAGMSKSSIEKITHSLQQAADPSPLSRNEDVKQTLLEATPWTLDAEREEEQFRNLALFLDTARINKEMAKTDAELRNRQNADGGWPWMPEGQSSLWVTQQVLTRLAETSNGIGEMVVKALAYVDREQQHYYEKYIKPHLKKGYNCEPTNIDYLYMRSFHGKAKTEAYKFYYANALKNYRQYENLYTQAQLALIFYRNGNKQQAQDLLRRIKQKSLVSDEMGMYWRDNRSGWYWYQRPIETQALLIDAFAEVSRADTIAISLMQQWLLKQRQTTHWGNDLATTRALEALMRKGLRRGSDEPGSQTVSLVVFGDSTLRPQTSDLITTLEDYRSHRWTGPALDTLITHNSSLITLKKTTPGIAWASVCYQYTDDIDRIPASETGITLKRSYLNLSNPNTPSNQTTLKVGDRVRVRIEITADRAMDYLQLVDMRPACVEPVSTRSGRRWGGGLSYYVEVKNTDTRCYIDHIDKGHYVFEYEVYVTNPGTFLAGPVTMQCMYAPEFRALAPAQRIEVR
ncbi:MAG: hypothetical protein IJ634_05265 [Bacteroidales bacterium]|nr:hypothetical protein [Bacteroidales bacterium]